MADEKFDVLVVGAGPAGSFAAERLARGGARVALFDGRPPNEPKACGGGVTSKALKAWPHLLEAVGRTIDELELYSPAGQRLHLKLTEPFAPFSQRLDYRARPRARQALKSSRIAFVTAAVGHEENCTVALGAARELSAPVLVAADAQAAHRERPACPLPPPRWRSLSAIARRAASADAPTVVAFLPVVPVMRGLFRARSFSLYRHPQDAFDHQRSTVSMVFYGRYTDAHNSAAPALVGRARDQSTHIIRTELHAVAKFAARMRSLGEDMGHAGASGEVWALLCDAAVFADPLTGEGLLCYVQPSFSLKPTWQAIRPLMRRVGARISVAS